MLTKVNHPQVQNILPAMKQANDRVQMERKLSMNITITQKQGRVPVTVLHLEGKLDGSNYMQLVEEARRAYTNGVSDLLLDLSQLTYLSSAGIAAIHQTALIFRGLPMAEEESGWAAYHAIDRDRGSQIQSHVKLLSPQHAVAEVLEITGFNSLFEIHTELATAVASFQ
jgi:anti-anti-sigma regulatory factor